LAKIAENSEHNIDPLFRVCVEASMNGVRVISVVIGVVALLSANAHAASFYRQSEAEATTEGFFLISQ
jgi:hypothetical protein